MPLSHPISLFPSVSILQHRALSTELQLPVRHRSRQFSHKLGEEISQAWHIYFFMFYQPKLQLELRQTGMRSAVKLGRFRADCRQANNDQAELVEDQAEALKEAEDEIHRMRVKRYSQPTARLRD